MPIEVSPYPMIAVSEAMQIVVQHGKPLPAERVPRAAALGRVLAEDVSAHEDQPPFIASTVDGYALRSDDGQQPRRLRGDVRAGTSAGPISRGEAVRIMTGAPMPEGADTVVMFEWAVQQGDLVTPEAMPKPGENLRPIGSDLRAGDLVLPAGTRIGPVETGLLAALGIREVRAHRLPTVAVLTTGDEIVDADSEPSGPVIRDSNAPTALAVLQEWGYPAVFLGIARDKLEDQEAAIRAGLRQADVVITSGGVSVGSHDLIKSIFSKVGTIHFGRILFKPGKPLTFATAGDKLLFGLPGNPVSAYVCLSLFVRPALRRLAGESDVLPVLAPAVAGEPLRPSADRPDYQRAVARWEHGALVVRTTGTQGSSRLRSLAGANALAIVPIGTQPLAPGSPVTCILLGPVGGDAQVGI